MEQIKEIALYCAKRIEGWDNKVALALDAMGRHEQIDWAFRNEVESRACEWCDEHDVSVDFFEGINVEEILWAEC